MMTQEKADDARTVDQCVHCIFDIGHFFKHKNVWR